MAKKFAKNRHPMIPYCPAGWSSITKTGLHLDLHKVDGRTMAAKVRKVLLEFLREYVGECTVATELLLHRIAYKSVRLSLYESKMMQEPDKEADVYLPMANSLRLDLQALAQMAGKKKPPDLGSYIDTSYGKAKKK